MDVNGLKAWPEIAQLRDVSGLASYTTHFDLPATWSAAHGATLTLGEVFDSFTVTVNGQAVAIDQISAEADAGPYLKAGANTLTVRVATTLNNRLASLDPDVAQSRDRPTVRADRPGAAGALRSGDGMEVARAESGTVNLSAATPLTIRELTRSR